MECPKCKSKEKQIWYGKNKSGSQSWKCCKCGRRYTPKPNSKAYSEEVHKQVFKLHFAGMSGRTIGKILGMSKANVYNWANKFSQCG